MRRRRIATLVLALIVAVAAAAVWQVRQSARRPPAAGGNTPVSTPAEAPDTEAPVPPAVGVLRFAPADGEVLAYAFSATGAARVDVAFLTARAMPGTAAAPEESQGLQDVSLLTEGTLFLKFYRRTPDTWQVAARIDHLRHRVDDTVPPYAAAMSYPFTFSFNSRGFLSAFRFVPHISTQARQLVRQLLGAMQTGFPEAAKSEWRTREIDATGTYRALYRADAGPADAAAVTIEKRKLDYLSPPSGNRSAALPGTVVTRVDDSRGTIRLVDNGPWIVSVTQNETITALAQGKTIARNRTSFSARREDKTPQPPLPDRFADAAALLEAERYQRQRYYATDPQLDRLAQGATLEQALERFLEIRASEAANAGRLAERYLVTYLRRHPEACATLIGLMDGDPLRERFDQSEHLLLWRLIVAAGHVEAQQAFVDVLRDPDAEPITRYRAASYSHDFEHPEEALADALWEVYASIPAGAADAERRQLKNMALLAAGSLGHADKHNDALKPVIGGRLTDILATAGTREERMNALAAIGNYGGTDALEAVVPHLSDGDAFVRRAACRALRRMDDPRAAEALMATCDRDDDARVREAALKALAQLPVTPAVTAWAAARAAASRPAAEQIRLVRLLGESLEAFPQNESALRELLQTNPAIRVRQDIYRYITP